MNKEILLILKQLGFEEKRSNSEFWKFESYEMYIEIPKTIEDKFEVMKYIVKEIYAENSLNLAQLKNLAGK